MASPDALVGRTPWFAAGPLTGILLFTILLLPLPAQTGAAKPATIEGTVTNSVTGAPIPRVHVTLQGSINGQAGQYGTTTSADGRFSITGIGPGSYSLAGQRIGFVMQQGARAGVRLTLKADDSKTAVDLQLTPTGAITGRVTDSDGEPVEGAQVFAQGPRSGESGTTDEKGQFRIGGLAPGKYHVKTSGKGDLWGGRPEIRTDGTVEVHDAATYYPEALTEKEAGRVSVQPGVESAGVDIQLVRVPFVRVSGKVVGLPHSVDHADIMVWQEQSGTGTKLKPDGSFEIWRLVPGKYRLDAEWIAPDGQRAKTVSADIVVAGSNIDNIELRLVPDSDIAGQIESDASDATKPDPKTTVTLIDRGTGWSDMMPASVGPDNTFRLEKVPAGKYTVKLSSETSYVKSMRLGSTIIDGAILDLSNGSGGADLSLLVTKATGSISGTVRDDQGNAAAGALVSLAAENEERHITSGTDGTYSLPNLPPGNYRIVAMQDAGQGNSAFGYEDLMEDVAVQDGEKATKDLTRRTPDTL